jgi:predicted transcriptional regulator
MVKIDRISLYKQGLTKFFSPNEVRILEVLWDGDQMTSSEICEQLDDLSLACVAGTLDRLVKSGFAQRSIDKTESRVRYLYSSVGDREEVGLRISEKVIDSLVETFGYSTVDTIGKTKRKGKR